MKIKAQNTLDIKNLDSVLDLSTDEALSIALDNSVNQELEPAWYDELLSKLGDTQQAAFTSGLVERGIRVMSSKQNPLINKLKNHFIALANKQGCVYEDDYHDACYDLTDNHVLGEINTWLLSAGLPLKKNKPKFETEYKKMIQDTVKHPNIKKLKKGAKEKEEKPVIKKKFPDKMPESDLVQKKTDYPPLSHLNKVINELKDKEFKTEFLPPWGKKEAQKYEEDDTYAIEVLDQINLDSKGQPQEVMHWRANSKSEGEEVFTNRFMKQYGEEKLGSAWGEEEGNPRYIVQLVHSKTDAVLRDNGGIGGTVRILDWEGVEEEAAVGQEINMYDDGHFPIGGKKAQQQAPFGESDIDEFFESGLEFEQAPKAMPGGDLDKVQRFQELQAKQAQGMLTPDEEVELSALMEELGSMMPALAKKLKAQRIDEEKRQLEDTIRAREDQIPDAQSLLQRVRKAFDFSDLRNIWEEIKMLPAFATEATKDPVEASIQKSARKEFQTATSKKKVQFENCSFTAHVANTELQKAAGLEAFDELQPNEGMLFPFDNPYRVTFHMGAVKFPIDIIFLMEDPTALKVAKIIHNAQPGAIEHWSCPHTSYVLEVVGGTAKKNEIKIGSECVIKDRIFPKE